DIRKQRIEVHAVLDQRRIRIAAETVLAANDVRDVMLDIPGRDQKPAREPEVVALALAATGDDDDAVAAATSRRLHDESIAIGDYIRKTPHLCLVADDAKEFWNGHACLNRQFLRQHLVVDSRIESSRIQAHDEVGVRSEERRVGKESRFRRWGE